MNTSFHDQVLAILPKLRIQALALTRNRSAADNLVNVACAAVLRGIPCQRQEDIAIACTSEQGP